MSLPYSSLQRFILLSIFLISFSSHAEEERAKRPFAITEIPEAHLSVYIPVNPEWDYSTSPRNGTYAVSLVTPADFYPPASMEIVLNHKLHVEHSELATTALTALNVVRQSSGLSEEVKLDQLKQVTYGEIEAYEDNYVLTLDGVRYSVRSVMGIMPSGKPITMFLATAEGQLQDIESLSATIWRHLKELD